MILGVAVAVAAAGMAGAQSTQPAPASDAPPAAVQVLVENCDAHKFETVIEMTVNGELKHSKVKMCGMEGQSDADWLRTLNDAIEKTAGNPKMPQSIKDQIIGAVKLEIIRLGGSIGAPPKASALIEIPNSDLARKPVSARPAPPPAPLARDYTSLPPLASAAPPPPRLITPGGPALLKPRLSLQCFNQADLAAAPCTAFERDTLVTVSAGENLPAGTSVRFVRGDTSADVAVAGLARGRSMHFTLPGQVCAGVGGGTLEVQIVRASGSPGVPPQVVGSDGPFNLRC